MNYDSISTIAHEQPEVVEAGQEALNKVLARSATDAGFRTRLLADPREALAEALGREVPATFDIAFVENTAGATVVLPDFVDPDAELSKDDLEAVAGGIEPLTVALICGGIGILVGIAVGSRED